MSITKSLSAIICVNLFASLSVIVPLGFPGKHLLRSVESIVLSLVFENPAIGFAHNII